MIKIFAEIKAAFSNLVSIMIKIHCKKGYSLPRPKPGCVANQTLPGRELLNLSRPGRVWLVTSRLGTG
jgi:hypothetical protein